MDGGAAAWIYCPARTKQPNQSLVVYLNTTVATSSNSTRVSVGENGTRNWGVEIWGERGVEPEAIKAQQEALPEVRILG